MLIEAETYRRMGHHINDPGDYMPPDEVAAWTNRDPLAAAQDHLTGAGIAPEEITKIDQSIESQVAGAVAFAMKSAEPDVAAFLTETARLDDSVNSISPNKMGILVYQAHFPGRPTQMSWLGVPAAICRLASAESRSQADPYLAGARPCRAWVRRSVPADVAGGRPVLLLHRPASG